MEIVSIVATVFAVVGLVAVIILINERIAARNELSQLRRRARELEMLLEEAMERSASHGAEITGARETAQACANKLAALAGILKQYRLSEFTSKQYLRRIIDSYDPQKHGADRYYASSLIQKYDRPERLSKLCLELALKYPSPNRDNPILERLREIVDNEQMIFDAVVDELRKAAFDVDQLLDGDGRRLGGIVRHDNNWLEKEHQNDLEHQQAIIELTERESQEFPNNGRRSANKRQYKKVNRVKTTGLD